MKIVFLDRDGVINEELGYVYKIQDFKFIDGVLESCKYLQKKGFQFIVITNQSGIGRGYYEKKDFDSITQWMLGKFNERGIDILDVFYCPHKAEDQCSCRKPKTGMFDKAYRLYPIDKSNSWMIGDKESDIEAANRFGIKNTILVESGHKIEKENSKATFVLSSIKEVNDYII